MTRLQKIQLQTGILVGLALVLLFLCAAWAADISTTQKRAREQNLLPVFEPEEIVELHLESEQAGSSVVLTRDPEDPDPRSYSLAYPGSKTSTHADEAAIAQLLSTLQHAPLLRRLEEPLPAEQVLGFDTPVLELSATMGPRSLRVLVGGLASTPEGARFVKVSVSGTEDVVGVVSSQVAQALSRDGRAFLGKLVFRYGASETKKVRLETRRETIELVRDALGFRLQESGLRADRERIDGLFFQMARTSISEFTDIPTEDAFSEVASIHQVTSDGRKLSVRLAESCPKDPSFLWLYRASPDPVAGCVARTLPYEIDREHFTSHSLAPVRKDEVDHVIIDWKGKRTDLVRKDGDFLLQAPEQKIVSRELGTDFLGALLELRGKRVPAPEEPHSGTVRLSALPPHAQSAHWLEVDLYELEGSNGLVFRRKDDGASFLLPQAALQWLDPGRKWFADRTVFSIEPTQVREITIIGQEGEERLTRRNDEALGTDFYFADGRPADPGLVQLFLAEFHDLTALRFTTREQLETGRHGREITLELDDGTSRQLTLGSRTKMGYLASRGSRDETFIVSPESYRTLSLPLRDRRPAELSPENIERAELHAFGESTELVRREGQLVVERGLLPDLGQALEGALSELEIVSAIREKNRPPLATPELRLDLTLVSPKGATRELSFDGLIASEARPLQRMRVSGVPYDFAVDRASVLRLLDLL